MDGSDVKDLSSRLPSKAPHFDIITTSIYNDKYTFAPLSTAYSDEVFPCECTFRQGITMDEQACGEDSGCINRSLLVECKPADCPCRDRCQNQRFQKFEYANFEIRETPGKGFGVFSRAPIKKGQLISEYVGEVVSKQEFDRRAEAFAKEEQRHFYFMTLQSDQIIDATNKGNLARFLNHSCAPNCATQKWIVDGQLRIGLFAIVDVEEGRELTFDYKSVRIGADAQECLCGEPCCKGIIGVKQKSSKDSEDGSATATLPPSSALDQIDEDSIESAKLFTNEETVTLQEKDHVALLARLLLKSEDFEEIKKYLRILSRCKERSLLQHFQHLHGLQLLCFLLGQYGEQIEFLSLILDVLEALSPQNKQAIKDAKIEEKILQVCSIDESVEAEVLVAERIKVLFEKWAALSTFFRIPKKKRQAVDNVSPLKAESAITVGYSLLPTQANGIDDEDDAEQGGKYRKYSSYSSPRHSHHHQRGSHGRGTFDDNDYNQGGGSGGGFRGRGYPRHDQDRTQRTQHPTQDPIRREGSYRDRHRDLDPKRSDDRSSPRENFSRDRYSSDAHHQREENYRSSRDSRSSSHHHRQADDHRHAQSSPSRQDQEQNPAQSTESPSMWLSAQTEDGQTYYYHRISRETRWDLPPAE